MANNGGRPAPASRRIPRDRAAGPRDIVLIGGSAGAIETLTRLVGALPKDFPASILVVVHTSAESPSVLPRVLQRAGLLPAKHPLDGERLTAGQIYVAPSDQHLVLGRNDTIHVRKGPRENGHRPAIDPLFRSAVANGYGRRLIAVILSGYLDDGSAGLYAIRSRGGLAIVQDPNDAMAPDMPANAVSYAGADYILPATEIGRKLTELVGQVSKVIPMTAKKKKQPKKAAIVGGNGRSKAENEVAPNELVSYPEESVGRPSVFACPECHGVLWEIEEGGSARYRCRVGHAYSEATLNEELSHAAESALWAAMRALDEKAAMSRRMAEAATSPSRWSTRLREQADTYAGHADLLRRMILGEPPAENAQAESDDAERRA